MCTAGGQNVHCGLINLRAAITGGAGETERVRKVEGQLGRREPLTLEKPSNNRSVGWEWENGMWNSLL